LKILHFADLHLGIDTHGAVNSETGLSNRVEDFLGALDTIIDRAIDEPVNAVLFAGDAFKNRDPNPTLQREFARRINRLARSEIPTVLLVGNHDLPGIENRATSTEIYQVLEIPGVHVSRWVDLIRLPTAEGELQVITVPWISRGMLLAHDQFRRFSDKDLDTQVAEAIATLVAEKIAELDPDLPAVLLGHLSLQGAVFGHERSIMLGSDVTVGSDELNVSAFDYVALGHIHKHQVLRLRPPVVYAGSPERVDFGEEKEDKGYVMVDITAGPSSERRADFEFVRLPAREFLTIRIDARGDDAERVVRSQIEQRSNVIRGAVVRCFITVDAGQESAISPVGIRKLLISYEPSHVANVVVESDAAGRARMDVSSDEMLDSVKMLEHWVQMRDYAPDFQERVLTLGKELIDRQRESKE
jgi:DNA repair protein SbcD/Mre11